jgi:hypothetical protein
MQETTDSWLVIEDAARQAFLPSVSDSPGMVAVLRRAIRFAHTDATANEIVLDRRAVILGLVAVGLGVTGTVPNNTATWFASWLALQPKVTDLASAIVAAEMGAPPTDGETSAQRDTMPVGAAAVALAHAAGAAVVASRACRQLSQQSAATMWNAARKFLEVLS